MALSTILNLNSYLYWFGKKLRQNQKFKFNICHSTEFQILRTRERKNIEWKIPDKLFMELKWKNCFDLNTNAVFLLLNDSILESVS